VIRVAQCVTLSVTNAVQVLALRVGHLEEADALAPVESLVHPLAPLRMSTLNVDLSR